MHFLVRLFIDAILRLARQLDVLVRRRKIDENAPLVGPFARFRAWVRASYMQVDLRAAGIFRIVIGFLMTADAIRHASEARLLYSNVGILTNDYHLWQRTNGYEFSWFHAFSTLNEVKVCFALGILCHVLLMLGYRSRLMAFLSFVFVTSMDSRAPFVENGGYVVVNLSGLWATFLPVERRFSIDAWLRSWRARRETSIAELADRSDFANERAGYASIIGLLTVVNIGAIYFWNVVNKAGDTWREGLTIHFVLYLNRMVTGLGVFSRDIIPEWLLRPIDWLTLCGEAMLCVLILSPKAKRYTRPIAITGMVLLHSTFGTMMRLGPFSWFLIGCSPILLTRYQFEDIRRLDEPRCASFEVGLDASSPLALALGRIAMRLDAYGRLTFVPREGEKVPLVSLRKASSEGDAEWIATPRDVVRGIARSLPLGRYLYPFVGVLTLGRLPSILAYFDAHRAGVARFFGIGKKGPTLPAPSAVRSFFAAEFAFYRELFLAWLGVTALMQTWNENKGIPPMLHFEEPLAVQATINYPRIFQGWGMFAPNPITEDGILVFDAYTIDGRRIDPYNGGGAPLLDITHAHGLGISQLRQDYGNRIRLDHNQHFREGMREWISHYQEETGNPNDEIVAFDAYWVRAKCPAVGSDVMYDNDAVPIFSWRKPGYRRPPDMPPIPPPPVLRTAEEWPDQHTIKPL